MKNLIDHVRAVIIDRWDKFNMLLQILLHALKAKHYVEYYINANSVERKSLHKGTCLQEFKASLTNIFLNPSEVSIFQSFCREFASELGDFADFTIIDENKIVICAVVGHSWNKFSVRIRLCHMAPQ